MSYSRPLGLGAPRPKALKYSDLFNRYPGYVANHPMRRAQQTNIKLWSVDNGSTSSAAQLPMCQPEQINIENENLGNSSTSNAAELPVPKMQKTTRKRRSLGRCSTCNQTERRLRQIEQVIKRMNQSKGLTRKKTGHVMHKIQQVAIRSWDYISAIAKMLVAMFWQISIRSFNVGWIFTSDVVVPFLFMILQILNIGCCVGRICTNYVAKVFLVIIRKVCVNCRELAKVCTSFVAERLEMRRAQKAAQAELCKAPTVKAKEVQEKPPELVYSRILQKKVPLIRPPPGFNLIRRLPTREEVEAYERKRQEKLEQARRREAELEEKMLQRREDAYFKKLEAEMLRATQRATQRANSSKQPVECSPQALPETVPAPAPSAKPPVQCSPQALPETAPAPAPSAKVDKGWIIGPGAMFRQDNIRKNKVHKLMEERCSRRCRGLRVCAMPSGSWSKSFLHLGWAPPCPEAQDLDQLLRGEFKYRVKGKTTADRWLKLESRRPLKKVDDKGWIIGPGAMFRRDNIRKNKVHKLMEERCSSRCRGLRLCAMPSGSWSKSFLHLGWAPPCPQAQKLDQLFRGELKYLLKDEMTADRRLEMERRRPL